MPDKSLIDKLPASLILVAVALGLPAAVATQSSAWALANPWKALGLFAVWGVLVRVGSLILKVWVKREPVVVDWLLDQIDRTLLQLFSPGRR